MSRKYKICHPEPFDSPALARFAKQIEVQVSLRINSAKGVSPEFTLSLSKGSFTPPRCPSGGMT